MTVTIVDTGNMPEHWRQIMKLSMEESARAWFLKNLDIGQTVRVPDLKGKGVVKAISGTLLVDMIDGPYHHHLFELGWDQIARLF